MRLSLRLAWSVSVMSLLRPSHVMAQRGDPGQDHLTIGRTSDGAVFIQYLDNIRPLVPDPISDADLAAAPTPTQQALGSFLPIPTYASHLPVQQRIVAASDGKLFDIVHNASDDLDGAWLLVPTDFPAALIANLKLGPEIDGTLPPSLGGRASAPPPTDLTGDTVDANAPSTSQSSTQTTICDAIGDGSQPRVLCGDGTGYSFDSSGTTVSLFDVANRDDDATQGPWSIAPNGVGGGQWVDPVHGSCSSAFPRATQGRLEVYCTK